MLKEEKKAKRRIEKELREAEFRAAQEARQHQKLSVYDKIDIEVESTISPEERQLEDEVMNFDWLYDQSKADQLLMKLEALGKSTDTDEMDPILDKIFAAQAIRSMN